MPATMPQFTAASINSCKHGSLFQFAPERFGIVVHRPRANQSTITFLLELTGNSAVMRHVTVGNFGEIDPQFEFGCVHERFHAVPQQERLVFAQANGSAAKPGMLAVEAGGWFLTFDRGDGQISYIDMQAFDKIASHRMSDAVCFPVWDLFVPRVPINGADHVKLLTVDVS